MKTGSIIAASALILASCMFGTENESSVPEHVGFWVGSITPQTPQIGAFVQEEILIEMNIEETSAYDLNVTYPESARTALTSTGTWSQSNDTLYLNGTECTTFDEEGNPGQMECTVIPVPIEFYNDMFLLSLNTLVPLAPSMGITIPAVISPEMLDGVSLSFERKGGR
ncbi:MAG: hypothetical protein ACLFVQ_02850 [Chitinispirillaceae bacterium]